MTKKIIGLHDAETISKEIKEKNQNLVLCGGCFDILHIGHIKFLESAKKSGDKLFILLESDEFIKKNKGYNRPINSQKDRAAILSSLECVDYIILLNGILMDEDYDRLILNLKPAIIATTSNDRLMAHKSKQAKLVGAKLIKVTNPVKNQSTSRIAQILHKEL